jgi:hypothetical protein
MNFDLSSVWRMVSGALGANHPIRLAVGCALSCFVRVLILVLARSFPEQPALQALDGLSIIWYLIIFTPMMFVSIVFGRGGAPENVVTQINTLDALISKGGFSPGQKTLMWRSLTDKYLTALKPDFSTSAPKLDDLYSQVEKETRLDPP